MSEQSKIDEILQLLREERQLNNSRFSQLSSGLNDFRQETRQEFGKVRSEMKHLRLELFQLFLPT